MIEVLRSISKKCGSLIYRFFYQASGLFDQRPIHSVHLVIQSARIAQVVSCSVPAPERSLNRAAIDAFSSLGKQVRINAHFCQGWKNRETKMKDTNND